MTIFDTFEYSNIRVIPILNTHLNKQDFSFSPPAPYDIR